MVGRNMANHFFFKALMRYGSFDEYHFFLSNRAHRNLFEQQHAPFLNKVGAATKIRLFDRVDLPDALATVDYTVFHQSDHVTYMAALARLRNEMGVAVPITAFIHSLSYPAHMTRYMELNLSKMNGADVILCSSECGQEVVRKCLQNASVDGVGASDVTLKVMPLGIDEQPLSMDCKASRQRLGFGDDEVVGLCFGRFSDFDKMDLFPLLQALKSIDGQKNRLVLAGAVHDQEYFKILKLWVRALGLTQRVEFVEQPSDEKKEELFLGCDFFVSIADNPQETFGLTVLEAMNAGTPVVVSDFDGYRELAGDEAGIRVSTTWTEIPRLTQLEELMDMRTLHRYLAQSICVDMDSLKEALGVMYTQPEKRKQYGRQAKERFDTHFAHARTVERLEQFWFEQKKQFAASHTPLENVSQIGVHSGAHSHTGRQLQMNVYDTFSHYVTTSLQLNDQVKVTDFAQQLLHVGANYPLLPSMSEVVDAALVKQIALWCNGRQPFPRVLELFEQFGDHWKMQLIVMWMLKHDLLERVRQPKQL